MAHRLNIERFSRLSPTTPAPPFIAGIDGTGLFFTDQYDQPIMVRSDTVWAMPVNAGRWGGGTTWQSDITNYMDARGPQGYNAMEIAALGSSVNGGPFNTGATWDSELPFVGGEPGTLNEGYWERVDHILDEAEANGMTVLFNFAYSDDLDNASLNGKTNTQLGQYGTALGNRYGSRPNLVWMCGGDYFGTFDTQLSAILTGIRGTGDTHLIGLQNYPETTSRRDLSNNSAQQWGIDNAQFNFVYTYNVTYFGIEYAWDEASPLTVLWGDGHYDQVTTADRHLMRNLTWWALSCGSRGTQYGSEAIWAWGSGAMAALSAGVFAASDLPSIWDTFTSLSGWHLLRPDTDSSLVTAGRNTRATSLPSGGGNEYNASSTQDPYITASVTPDGSLAVIYFPVSDTITVDDAELVANYTARWVDPVDGTSAPETTGSSYTTPGTNSVGDDDWVLVLEGAAPPAPLFVTDVSANGRYFVDSNGDPTLVRADSPWAMFSDLSPTQMDTYLANRASYGTNLLLCSMVGSVANGGPNNNGSTFDGILPFVGGDITAFNETYWSRMDSYIAKARDLGIGLLIYPMDGWNTVFDSTVFNAGVVTQNQCRTYGQNLAERYAGEPHILWSFGGDYLTNGTIDGLFDACLEGIRLAGNTALCTIQLRFEKSLSSDSSFWNSRVDFNFVYTYYVTYKAVSDGYDHVWSTSPTTRPSLFSEGAYENSFEPHPGTDEVIRRQACWALTSGSPGEFTGQEGVWNFQSGWEDALDTTAAGQLQAIRDTFDGLAWWTLVPDDANDLVTAGRGTRITTDAEVFPAANNYVTAARAPDGSLAVIYLPNAASTITIDEQQMSGGYTATWVDPASGATVTATVGPTYSRGVNSVGDTDWLLVLEGGG